MVPFIAVQQSSYDAMKAYALNNDLQASISLCLLCGGVAGVLAQTVSQIVFDLSVLSHVVDGIYVEYMYMYVRML